MDSTIENSIANLTPEQAQRAVSRLYELLPDAWWEDGKPTPGDIKGLAGEAPQELAALEGQDESSRGEMASEVLRRFAALDAARPLVEQAVKEACQARLAPLPLLILPLLIVLSGVEIKAGGFSLQIGVPGSGSELVKSIAQLAKSLPTGAWNALLKLRAGA